MNNPTLREKIEAFLIHYGNSVLTTQPITGPGYVEPPIHIANRANVYTDKIEALLQQELAHYTEQVKEQVLPTKTKYTKSGTLRPFSTKTVWDYSEVYVTAENNYRNQAVTALNKLATEYGISKDKEK